MQPSQFYSDTLMLAQFSLPNNWYFFNVLLLTVQKHMVDLALLENYSSKSKGSMWKAGIYTYKIMKKENMKIKYELNHKEEI